MKYPPERQTSSLESQDSINRKTRSWTRDEMRYMKDAPVISPVSYPSRVAPLPEDRMKVGEEEKADKNEGLERERRKVEEYRRRGGLAYEKQEESLPFPTLIKVENTNQNNRKKGKMNYDLKEAIQLAKVFSFSFVQTERDYLSLDKRYPQLYVSSECSKVVILIVPVREAI
ncbi:hypothetical protein OROMI_017122 [Orobanche minor]